MALQRTQQGPPWPQVTPLVSLNAMGGLESCHSPVGALILGLVEAFWPVLASASIATACG